MCGYPLPIRTALVLVATAGAVVAEEVDGGPQAKHDRLRRAAWEEVFSDRGTGRWQDLWFLDGKKAAVDNSTDGMTIDATQGYAVLWTKESFRGDLRIEYGFKRIDRKNRGVNIIYIQATGDGQEGHAEDISLWSDRRETAAMSDYFLNMHTYHISYAAYPNFGFFVSDYVRGRRYLPLEDRGLKGTELEGELSDTGIFEDGEWIEVEIYKKDNELLARFGHPEKEPVLVVMRNVDKPAIEHGRIGLRLMPGRVSCFRDFKVFGLAENGDPEAPD